MLKGKKIPLELIESFKGKKAGIFIGAGLSQGAGLPNWGKLLITLIDYAENRGLIDSKKSDELKNLIHNPSKYLMVAEEIRDILTPSIFHKRFKIIFDDKSIKPTITFEKFLKLPYKFIITTNYDNLIENAYVKLFKTTIPIFTYKNPDSINYSIWDNQPFILKAHGEARNAPSEIIITEKDYRNIIYREKGYQSVLQVLFSTHNILFLGASLSDPEINLLLGYIHNIFHGGTPEHFALMDESKITQTESDRWEKDFNIHIIPVSPNNNFEEIDQLLDEINASIT
jgi:hypothetical protein